MLETASISAGEIVIIITSTAGALVTVINAVANGWGRKEIKDLVSKADSNSNKLDNIHISTNGNLSVVQAQLNDAMKMIRELQQDARDKTNASN